MKPISSDNSLPTLDEAPRFELSRADREQAPRFTRRFRTRIFIYITALSLVTSLTSAGIFTWRQTIHIDRDREVRSKTLLTGLATHADIAAYAGDPALCELAARSTLDEEDVGLVAIYDRHGREIFERPKINSEHPAPDPQALRLMRSNPDAAPVKVPRGTFIDLYAPIVTQVRDPADSLVGPNIGPLRREVVGVARVGLLLEQGRRQVIEVILWGLYLAVGILALGVIAAVLISRKVSRPVAELTLGADLIRAGRLDTRVNIQSKDEIGQLGYAFNRMAARLAETMAALEALNRDLEAEVARRTLTIQRAAAFTALLNAPVRQRGSSAMAPRMDTGEWTVMGGKMLSTAHASGRASGALAQLLDKALRALMEGSESRAAAILLVDEESVEFALEVSWCIGVVSREIGQTPTEDELSREAAWYDGRRLVVPLHLGDELAGCILLFRDSLPPTERVQFATHAASQLAIAVSNVLAYAAQIHLARELRERNVALAKQRDQLQEMNRLKSEFLANTSHELRTPLNAIMGYSELIADGVYGPLTPEQQDALTGIEESTRNLLTLIDNILDLAKVESGKITLHHDEVELRELVRGVLSEAAPLAKHRPYQIDLDAPRPVTLRTDGPKVKQIVTNLVSNAIKFTPEGRVEVALGTDAAGQAFIRVRDTGIGIRPEDQRIIFEEFRQVDGSYTRTYGGPASGWRSRAALPSSSAPISAWSRRSAWARRSSCACPRNRRRWPRGRSPSPREQGQVRGQG